MALEKEFQSILQKIRQESPLVHHITNYVTANDCANTVLALGGSAVMADDRDEVEEMTSLSSALVLNIGTLSQRTLASFLLAGKKANALGIPVILDPVGLGATDLRQALVEKILSQVDLTVLRGNMSELLSLSGVSSRSKGVDSTETTDKGGKTLVETLSRRLGCIVAVTGKVDLVSDGGVTYQIQNGSPFLPRVTGTGCMSTSIIGLCCATGASPLYGTLLGLSIIGISGEIAEENLRQGEGPGSFRVKLIDAFSYFTLEDYLERGKIYEPSFTQEP